MRYAFVLLLLAPAAHAGDPCPIDFRVHDLGAPSWLDRGQLLTALKSQDSWFGASFRTSKKGGVELLAVSPGSPAAAAGLQKGDRIVGVETHQAFAATLRAAPPGTALKITRLRGDAKLQVVVTLGHQDPVVGALLDHASSRECSAVRRGDLDPKQRAAVLASTFTKQRRFRCDDAHTALAGVDLGGHTLEGGDLVVVRGSKRLLLANPGWATVCVYARELDGPKLAPGVAPLFEKLTGGYVSDRHANP